MRLLPLLALLALTLPATAKRTRPALEIVSRFGAGADVRLFNDEPVRFRARTAGDPLGAFRRGVVFTLLVPGGHPDRSETVVARAEDGDLWGRPPTSFSLPLDERVLDPGKYVLRADAPDHRPAAITVRIARFAYIDLEKTRTKTAYDATFRLRLEDPCEARRSVPVRVRVMGPGGEVIDEREDGLAGGRKEGRFESRAPLRLSSRLRDAGDGAALRALRVVPGSSLVVLLDDCRFSWPVPLLPEEKIRTSVPRKGR